VREQGVGFSTVQTPFRGAKGDIGAAMPIIRSAGGRRPTAVSHSHPSVAEQPDQTRPLFFVDTLLTQVRTPGSLISYVQLANCRLCAPTLSSDWGDCAACPHCARAAWLMLFCDSLIVQLLSL